MHSLFLSPQITGHTSVYINEPRLSDFKQVLNKAGIQAEFAGGVLICNNVVAVRRVSIKKALVFSQYSLEDHKNGFYFPEIYSSLVPTHWNFGKYMLHKSYISQYLGFDFFVNNTVKAKWKILFRGDTIMPLTFCNFTRGFGRVHTGV